MEVVSGDNGSYKTAELQSVVHANKPTPSCLQVLLPNQQYQEHWREKCITFHEIDLQKLTKIF